MAMRNRGTERTPEENLEKIVPLNPPHSRRLVLDDDELALDLAEQWENNVSHFHYGWHEYTNGAWLRRDEQQMYNMVRRFLRPYRETHGVKVSARQVRALLDMMRAEAYRSDESITEAQANAVRYINLRNGLYDIEADTFIPEHQPELMLTSQLDFDYNPEAECPVFMDFLHSSLVHPGTREPDHDLIGLTLQALGYSLTARTDLKASFWLKGVTDSGKSTLLALIKSLMGSLATTIDLTQLGTKSFMLASIIGKRVVSFSEASANVVLPDALYKAIVGGSDEIWADVKGKEAIVFKPVAKFWWAMNESPRITDRSGATFNRLKLICFNRSFSDKEKDLDLLPKMIAERSGIFNTLLHYYAQLKHSGWRHVRQSEEMLAEYELENDTERSFVEDKCEVDREFSTQAASLYSAYNDWCNLNGFKPKNRNQVATEWRRLGFHNKKASNSIWHGVRLKSRI